MGISTFLLKLFCRTGHVVGPLAFSILLAVGAADARVALKTGDLLLADRSSAGDLGSLFRIDPDSGSREVLSGYDPIADTIRGTGMLPALNDVFVDDLGNIFAVGDFPDVVISIDPATGDRTVLNLPGNGPEMSGPVRLTVDNQGLVYVGDILRDSIFEINPSTMGTSIVSSNSKGSGPTWGNPRPVVIVGGELFAGDTFFGSRIAKVDRESGDRVTVSGFDTILDLEVGAGPSFEGTLVDTAVVSHTEILVLSNSGILYETNLESGNRTIVSSDSVGEGVLFESASALAYGSGKAYVGDFESDDVIAVDLDTGNRRVVSSDMIGQGPPFIGSMRGMAVYPIPEPTTLSLVLASMVIATIHRVPLVGVSLPV